MSFRVSGRPVMSGVGWRCTSGGCRMMAIMRFMVVADEGRELIVGDASCANHEHMQKVFDRLERVYPQ